MSKIKEAFQGLTAAARRLGQMLDQSVEMSDLAPLARARKLWLGVCYKSLGDAGQRTHIAPLHADQPDLDTVLLTAGPHDFTASVATDNPVTVAEEIRARLAGDERDTGALKVGARVRIGDAGKEHTRYGRVIEYRPGEPYSWRVKFDVPTFTGLTVDDYSHHVLTVIPDDSLRFGWEGWTAGDQMTCETLATGLAWEVCTMAGGESATRLRLAHDIIAEGVDPSAMYRRLDLPEMNDKGEIAAADMTSAHFERVRSWQCWNGDVWVTAREAGNPIAATIWGKRFPKWRPAIFAELPDESQPLPDPEPCDCQLLRERLDVSQKQHEITAQERDAAQTASAARWDELQYLREQLNETAHELRFYEVQCSTADGERASLNIRVQRLDGEARALDLEVTQARDFLGALVGDFVGDVPTCIANLRGQAANGYSWNKESDEIRAVRREAEIDVRRARSSRDAARSETDAVRARVTQVIDALAGGDDVLGEIADTLRAALALNDDAPFAAPDRELIASWCRPDASALEERIQELEARTKADAAALAGIMDLLGVDTLAEVKTAVAGIVAHSRHIVGLLRTR